MQARDLRARARQSLTGNYWPSVLVAFLVSICGGLVVGLGGGPTLELDADSLQLIMDTVPTLLILVGIIGTVSAAIGLASFIIGGVVQLGYAQYLLKQHDGQKAELKDAFSQFDRFGQGFLQNLLRSLYVFLWALLFIIPGIIKAYSYAMTPFIMAENPQMTAEEAINLSKQMMKGHKWELFCLEMSFIGWYLLAGLTMGIGVIFLNPYPNAAYAAFYRDKFSRPTLEAE